MNYFKDKDKSIHCEFPENDADEVVPGLFLGNYKSSYDKEFLNKNNIRYIIRVLPEFDYGKMYHGITYLHLPIKDGKMCSLNLNKMFDYTSDFIAKKLLNKEGGILVHCKRGHHRSAAIVAAFFIKHMHIDYKIAITYINNLRPCALRRDTCMVKGLFKYYLIKNNICQNGVCHRCEKCISCSHSTPKIINYD